MDEEPKEVDEQPQETWFTKKRIALIIAAVVVLLLVLCGAYFATNLTTQGNSGNTLNADNKAQEVSMVVNVTADGWDEKQSTKFGVVLTNLATNEKLTFEIEPNKDQMITAPEGEYEIEYISGVNADGSMWKVPEKSTISLNQEYVATNPVTTIPVERIEADKVTEKDKNNANTSGSLNDTPAANEAGGGDNTPAEPTTPSNSASNNNNPNSNTPASSNAHTHTWVEQTATRWVPNIVTVTDSAAWDEPVYTTETHNVWTCAACGFYGGPDRAGMNAVALHAQAAGAPHQCYATAESVQVQSGTIHHDAITHTEDQGHNETYVASYVCSGCGATK